MDKAIWQEALAQYRAWNEAEFEERVRNAGKLTLADRWRQYEELVSLCWALNPEPSPGEQQCTIEEWKAYYTALQRFEEKRAKHGQSIVDSIA